MKPKNIIWTLALIAAILIGYKLYVNKKIINEKNNPHSNMAVISIPVTADTVKLQSLDAALKKTGNLVPYKEAIVYPAIAGTIEQLHFELGKRVKQGQLLAVSDTQKLYLDLQKTTANEKKLKNELQSYIELLEGKATTQEKVNQLRLEFNDAQNQSAQIRRQLYDTKILSPISGIITEKMVEKGVYINSGTKIATVVDLSKVKVQVYLTESEVYQVLEKDLVSISTEVYPNKIFKGIITYISPQADETHSYLVEITLNNDPEFTLRSGTFVYATFSKKASQAVLVISREALLENTLNPTVYVVIKNKVVLKSVKTGRDIEGFVEILAGLNEGDLVVTSGQINLKNQSNITLLNKVARK